ncbi:MAG: GMC oxidoreductase [Planctomycetaceae bacterium]
MARRFDIIIVGSGFGGAVTACRAAEAGARVLVLERGRRWAPANYPRALDDPWLFDPERPSRKNGWLDVRLFRQMTVVQGAGVGGGSLCYSSVFIPAAPAAFANGWPAEITYESLASCYARAAEVMLPREVPDRQRTRRSALLKTAAEAAGYGDRFSDATLAVSFDPEWHDGLPDSLAAKHSRAFRNAQGRWQGTCVHLGNCDVGCDVRAKNTLDLNYLAQAERLGADLRPLHLVRSVEPVDGGYRVSFDRIDGGRRTAGSETAAKVVLAAGSLGTTELLLRCRDEHGTLPNLSDALGKNWSPNANVLSPAYYQDPSLVRQSIGPTISSMLDLMDGRVDGQRLLVEDDGFPNILLLALARPTAVARLLGFLFHMGSDPRRRLDEPNPLSKAMVWLGTGVDAADGVLRLRRNRLRPWRRKLTLRWRPDRSRAVVEAILKVHRQLSTATGAKFRTPFYWRWLRSLVTVHPLGGCRIGNSPADGVVDHRGEVFGCPNLFVADGSLLPGAIGQNPSMTIAALAERNSEFILRG